jgi:HEAT repeat protein
MPYAGAMTHETLQVLIQRLRGQPQSGIDIKASILRAKAADELGALGDPAAVPALIEALSDENYVCVCAALALAQMKHPNGVEPLVRVLEDSDKFWVPRGAAAVALGHMGELARPALTALTKAREYDCNTGEKWDLRAREAVEDAIRHIMNPSAGCSLAGRAPRFEMWGMY